VLGEFCRLARGLQRGDVDCGSGLHGGDQSRGRAHTEGG
jgi:hypothetical protein